MAQPRRLVLASTSAYRKALLERLALAFVLAAPQVDERPLAGEAPADTALRLARYFGTAPEFWLNLQSAYELRRAQQEYGARIAQEVRPRVAVGI